MRRILSVRPLKVGSGRGGRRGDEPPSSAVDVVEKAGDAARSEKAGSRLPRLSSLSSAAVGVEGSDEMVLSVHYEMSRQLVVPGLELFWSLAYHNEISADEAGVVRNCLY